MRQHQLNGKNHENFTESADQSADTVIEQFDRNTEALLGIIGAFDPSHINRIPFEGSWTAGQVAEHLLKSESGVTEIFSSQIKDTDRDPQMNVQAIRDTFLNFTIKFQSPAFIVPDDKKKEKNFLLNALMQNRASIRKAIETMDLSQTCMAFELPGLGYLTRIEWIHFVMAHSERHIRQMENIFAVLNAKGRM